MFSYLRSYCQHSAAILCKLCGAKGEVRWEQALFGNGIGPELIAISGAFFERLARRRPHAIELICGTCGTAQSGALQA